MPLIQSRKYGTEQFVTVETWKKFQETGRARRFKVIDDGDMQDTVIPTPQSFADFSEVINKEMNREDLKEWFDERGIEYNSRSTTPKLYQLYLDNQ